jgi:hypothetical protein
VWGTDTGEDAFGGESANGGRILVDDSDGGGQHVSHGKVSERNNRQFCAFDRRYQCHAAAIVGGEYGCRWILESLQRPYRRSRCLAIPDTEYDQIFVVVDVIKSLRRTITQHSLSSRLSERVSDEGDPAVAMLK